MRCLATQTNVSSHANQQIYSWAECAWILDISNPIAFNVSLAFTKNVYKWIHAKMPALKKCECMLCKGKRRGTSSSVCSFLLQDKMQRYGFLQPAFHKHLYYSKKMSVLQNYVLSFQTVLLSPNVINYCMEYVHNYRVKSWNRIVVYTHLFLRCFPLHEKSSAICPSPAFNAGESWRLLNYWHEGDGEGSCSLGVWAAVPGWDVARHPGAAPNGNLPCSHHTHQISQQIGSDET